MPDAIPIPIPDPAWDAALAFRPLVERAARHMARRRADVDDLIQEGLITLHRAMRRYNPARGTPDAFASRSVYNRLKDLTGRPRVHRLLYGGDVGEAPARPDRIDMAEWRDALAAIGRLPEARRAILLGRFGIDGPARTGEQMAALLGMRRDAVAKIEERTLARLKFAVGR